VAKLSPVKRDVLIYRLRKAGFEGPFAGGKHQFMIRGETRLVLPNPHRDDISAALLSRILKQAGMSRDQWLSLR